MLKFEHVKKQYNHAVVLDGLSMEVKDGAIYGLVGMNGAGKSTAVRILLGLEYPDEGTVLIDDMEPGSGIRRLKRRIGYVPEHFGAYPGMQVAEYMDFFAACYDMSGGKCRRRIQMLLDLVGLSDRQGQYLDSLSRGMQQRLALARALIHDPKYLILDEPVNGLDPSTRYDYRRILVELAENRKTILMTSGTLSEVSEICSDLGIMDQGKMVLEGNIDQVLQEVDSSNPVVISVGGAISDAMRILKADRRVKSLTIRGKELLVAYEGSEEDEVQLLKSLVAAGIQVRSFRREKGNLEALFLKRTGKREERRVTYYEAEPDLQEG